MHRWVLMPDGPEAAMTTLIASAVVNRQPGRRVLVAAVSARTHWVVLSEGSVSRSFNSPLKALRWANDNLRSDYRIEEVSG